MQDAGEEARAGGGQATGGGGGGSGGERVSGFGAGKDGPKIDLEPPQNRSQAQGGGAAEGSTGEPGHKETVDKESARGAERPCEEAGDEEEGGGGGGDDFAAALRSAAGLAGAAGGHARAVAVSALRDAALEAARFAMSGGAPRQPLGGAAPARRPPAMLSARPRDEVELWRPFGPRVTHAAPPPAPAPATAPAGGGGARRRVLPRVVRAPPGAVQAVRYLAARLEADASRGLPARTLLAYLDAAAAAAAYPAVAQQRAPAGAEPAEAAQWEGVAGELLALLCRIDGPASGRSGGALAPPVLRRALALVPAPAPPLGASAGGVRSLPPPVPARAFSARKPHSFAPKATFQKRPRRRDSIVLNILMILVAQVLGLVPPASAALLAARVLQALAHGRAPRARGAPRGALPDRPLSGPWAASRVPGVSSPAALSAALSVLLPPVLRTLAAAPAREPAPPARDALLSAGAAVADAAPLAREVTAAARALLVRAVRAALAAATALAVPSPPPRPTFHAAAAACALRAAPPQRGARGAGLAAATGRRATVAHVVAQQGPARGRGRGRGVARPSTAGCGRGSPPPPLSY